MTTNKTKNVKKPAYLELIELTREDKRRIRRLLRLMDELTINNE